jgi:hypothetical protein
MKFDKDWYAWKAALSNDIAAREACDISDVNAHWSTVEATHCGATAPGLDRSGKLASTNDTTTTARR